ncbi:hypothetical protein PG997_011959 [Apiospora hydei]|uniref:Uncharacterized protein n=1 Tax=Apiospora hydei TaxID=1337664 RepID=A0ABR1V2P7_9PEZI
MPWLALGWHWLGGWAARRGGHPLAFASHSVDLEPHDAAVLHGLVSALGALRDPSVRDLLSSASSLFPSMFAPGLNGIP